MSSSDDTRSYTSLSIPKATASRLDDIVDGYDFQGKGSAVSFLIDVVNAIDLPVSTFRNAEFTDVNPSDLLRGVIVRDSDSDQLRLVGVDGNSAHVITGVSTPESALQPLPRTDIVNGDIYCPACGSVITTYQLSDSLPGVSSGIFNDFTTYCDSCESKRPYYVLFVAQEDVSTTADVLMNAITSYYAYALFIDSYSPSEFGDRVLQCRSVARDGDGDWLPDPDEWIGFEIEAIDESYVTTQDYMDFIKRYVSYLVTESPGDDNVDVVLSYPSETDDIFDAQWQIRVDSQSGEVDPDLYGFIQETQLWETVSVTTQSIDDPGFASDSILVTFDGMESL